MRSFPSAIVVGMLLGLSACLLEPTGPTEGAETAVADPSTSNPYEIRIRFHRAPTIIGVGMYPARPTRPAQVVAFSVKVEPGSVDDPSSLAVELQVLSGAARVLSASPAEPQPTPGLYTGRVSLPRRAGDYLLRVLVTDSAGASTSFDRAVSVSR